MATPTTPAKKRVQGPRTVKDKVLYLVSPDDLSNLKIANTPEEAMDQLMANPGYKVVKHVVPVKRRAPTNQAPAQAA